MSEGRGYAHKHVDKPCASSDGPARNHSELRSHHFRMKTYSNAWLLSLDGKPLGGLSSYRTNLSCGTWWISYFWWILAVSAGHILALRMYTKLATQPRFVDGLQLACNIILFTQHAASMLQHACATNWPNIWMIAAIVCSIGAWWCCN